MEDVKKGVCEMCAIDVKLGKRLYDDAASEAKKAHMIEQSKLTTSGLLGLRICGAIV
jgi:Inositol polyphosphate kinase